MVKNTFLGKFIAIEGIDGAGKSTQAAMMAKYLRGKDKQVFLTSEPTQLLAGGLIRARLLGEWKCSPECLQLLFAADRAQHLEKEILPRLNDGVNVICDRYYLSSLAYGAIDCEFDWLRNINDKFLMPDLTIFLNIDAKTAAHRIAVNGRSIELFEKEEALEKVQKNYEMAIGFLGKSMVIELINGNNSKERVFGDVSDVFGRIFNI